MTLLKLCAHTMAQHRLGHIRIRDDAQGMVDEMRSAGQVRTYVLGKTSIWQSEIMPIIELAT